MVKVTKKNPTFFVAGIKTFFFETEINMHLFQDIFCFDFCLSGQVLTPYVIQPSEHMFKNIKDPKFALWLL